MRCPRCKGLMRVETIFTESGKVKCLICYSCGECIDPEILENRRESLARIRAARRRSRPVEME